MNALGKEVIMAFYTTVKQEENFQKFIEELTELSKKYNIAIKSTGGVIIYSPDEDLSDIVYTNDSSSGDLDFIFSAV